MQDDRLLWTLNDRKLLLHTCVFDVMEQNETAENGMNGDYIAVDTRDWVITIPVLGDDFVMVRQFRHATLSLSTEFPGGVAGRDEDPMEAAKRELKEETGFVAGKLTHLGSISPNPALFANTLHVYLAENLVQSGEQKLDEDEILDYMTISQKEVIRDFGTGEYTHGLMMTALGYYLRYIAEE